MSSNRFSDPESLGPPSPNSSDDTSMTDFCTAVEIMADEFDPSLRGLSFSQLCSYPNTTETAPRHRHRPTQVPYLNKFSIEFHNAGCGFDESLRSGSFSRPRPTIYPLPTTEEIARATRATTTTPPLPLRCEQSPNALNTIEEVRFLCRALHDANQLNEQYKALTESLHSTAEALTHRVRDLDGKLGEFVMKLSTADSKVEELNLDLSNASQRINTLESRLLTTTLQLTRTETKLAQQAAKLTESSSKALKLESKLHASDKKAEELNTEFDFNESHLQSLENRLLNTHVRIREVESNAVSAERRMMGTNMRLAYAGVPDQIWAPGQKVDVVD